MKLTNRQLKRLIALFEVSMDGDEYPTDYNEFLEWGNNYLIDVDSWTPQNTRKVFM